MQVFVAPELSALPVRVAIDPAGGVIALHPDLNHTAAVREIQAWLPDVHPDIIEHWVERVLPTVPDLAMSVPLQPLLLDDVSTRPARARGVRKRHKRPGRPVAIVRRVAAGIAPAGVGGLVVAMVFQPTMAGAAAWEDPIFLQVASAADISCEPKPDQPLRAQCVTSNGLTVQAEAMVGADSITYTFTGFGQSRAVVKIFSSERALAEWVAGIGNDARFPNLVTGDRVAVYGTDPASIEPFLPATGALSAEHVAPLVLRASYSMDLIPDDLAEAMHDADETLGPPPKAGVPEPVREQAMAVLTGDPRMRSTVDLADADPLDPEPSPVMPVGETPKVVVEPVDLPPRTIDLDAGDEDAVEVPDAVEPSPASTPAPAPTVERKPVAPRPTPTTPPPSPDEPAQTPTPEPGTVEPTPEPEPVDEVVLDELDQLLEDALQDTASPASGVEGEPVGPVHDQLVQDFEPLLGPPSWAAAHQQARGPECGRRVGQVMELAGPPLHG